MICLFFLCAYVGLNQPVTQSSTVSCRELRIISQFVQNRMESVSFHVFVTQAHFSTFKSNSLQHFVPSDLSCFTPKYNMILSILSKCCIIWTGFWNRMKGPGDVKHQYFKKGTEGILQTMTPFRTLQKSTEDVKLEIKYEREFTGGGIFLPLFVKVGFV